MIKPWQSDLDHWNWIVAAKILYQNKKILDLGCGSGYLCEQIYQRGATSCVGIDMVAPESKPKNWTFFERNLNEKGWASSCGEGFDFIFAFDILEHLESPFNLLRSCHALLGSSGRLVLTTPNISSWERLLRPASWSGVKDKQHKILFNKYSLVFTLERVGFDIEKLIAPIRKLDFLGALSPQWGGADILYHNQIEVFLKMRILSGRTLDMVILNDSISGSWL